MKTLDSALKGMLWQECKRKDFDEYTRLECEFEAMRVKRRPETEGERERGRARGRLWRGFTGFTREE